MPIEIRELVIKVTVESPTSEAQPSGTLKLSTDQLERLKREVLQACMAKLKLASSSGWER
ncbi:DUF5908 family protein [Spirosoma flavum]|uniref:DUF5908 family protein n=1 Tax=Spirosoma flavum TaxID=2048557 RepID=A0ABW6AKD3_9BACT